MTIILQSVITNVLSCAKGIRSQAGSLQALPSSFPFDQLKGPIDQMGIAIGPVQAFLATYTDATQVQAAADRVFLAGSPTTIRAKIAAVDTAHGAFSAAYATIYAGAGNLITYNSTTRQHGYQTIQISSLGSLSTPLANLVAACDALDYVA